LKKVRGKQRNRDFQRKQRFEKAYEVTHILCESEKTEPNYLKKIKKMMRLRHVEFKIRRRSGMTPKKLIECAKRIKNEDNTAIIWLVFDCDHYEYFDECIQKAKGKYKVAYSNPCIEFWFLLHFKYSTADITCSEATKQLKEKIPNYDKTTLGDFDLLWNNLNTALQHAMKLREHHENIGNKDTTNPSTTVDKLVKYLLEQK